MNKLLDIIKLKRVQLFEEEREFCAIDKSKSDKRTFARHLLDEIIEDYEHDSEIYQCDLCIRKITKKMLDTEKYVIKYIKEHSKAPTYRHVAKHFKLSLCAVYARLRHCRELMKGNKLIRKQ